MALALSTAVIARIHRGELDLGYFASAARGRPARMRFSGPLGTLVEKDLRVAWRDPALKASLFMALVSPLLFLFFMTQAAGGARGTSVLGLAVVVGVSVFGTNTFGLERRGIALLMSFPVERWRILVAKNLASIALRLPSVLTVAVASALIAPHLLPAAATIAVVGLLISAGVDNYASILFPLPAPEPGRAPGAAGGRGLGTMAMSALLLTLALMVAAPFVLLAWLPLLLSMPWLWMVTPAPRAGGGGGGVRDARGGGREAAAAPGARRPRAHPVVAGVKRPTVAVVGLGLVGGSLARALTAAGYRVIGHDRPAVLRAASARGRDRRGRCLRCGRRSRTRTWWCSPPRRARTGACCRRWRARRVPGAVLTDVGSVKRGICADARAPPSRALRGRPPHGRPRDLRASRPRSPTSSATAGGSSPPTPASRPAALRTVRGLVRAAGARPIVMTPAEHDRAVAFLSHVPQVLAWALLAAARSDRVASRRLAVAGPAFRDMTRLAGSPRPLWREILRENRAEVRQALDALRRPLTPLLITCGTAMTDRTWPRPLVLIDSSGIG